MDVGRSKTGSGLRALAAACAAAVLMGASATAALAASPPPPPPAPTGGGGGGGGGTPPPANVTPSHPSDSAPADTRAPGKVGHLRTITRVAGRITLLWTNPAASDLAGVVVRRGWAGACPTSQHEGVAVGGTAVRTRQIDTGAVDGQRYCYAIFAFDGSGNYSRSTVAHGVMNPGDRTPPGPVTNFTAVAQDGHVALSWRNPQHAGVAFDAVRRGTGATNCPTGPLDGTAIGGQGVRASQIDTTAQPGVLYCYRVFALDAAGNTSVMNSGADATAPRPVAPAPTPQATPPPSPPAPSSGWLGSTIVRMVAGIGLVMLLLMAGATIVTRRRTHTSAYIPARDVGPRIAMTGVPPVTLVIPALLVLGSCGAIALVLLNL